MADNSAPKPASKSAKSRRGISLGVKFSLGIAFLIFTSMGLVGWMVLKHQGEMIQEQLLARGMVQAKNLADAAREQFTDDLGLLSLVKAAAETGVMEEKTEGQALSLPDQITAFVSFYAGQLMVKIWPEEASAGSGNDVIYAQVVDRNGMVKADSQHLDRFEPAPYQAPSGVQPNTGSNPLVQDAGLGSLEMFDIDVPMELAGTPLGSVHLGLSKRAMTRALRQGQATILIAVVLVLGVSILLTGLLVAVMTRPIAALVKGVLAIAAGDLEQALVVSSHDELGELTRSFNDMAESLREKERMRGAFSKYVSADVVDQALKGETVTVGGETREISVYYSDIRKFTSISEAMSPEQLVLLLNEYFNEMVAIIRRHGGEIDKFIGDAIVAMYGAPREMEKHGLAAVRASLEMRKKMESLRVKWISEGKPEVRVGMGVATDRAIVGNVGSSSRINYTAMGDSVDMADLLEVATKTYLTSPILSENTWLQVREEVLTRELDLLRVEGRSAPLRIFEATELRGQATDRQKAVVDIFHQGLALYRQRRWDEASGCFKQILGLQPEDGPSRLYLDRCAQAKVHPPQPDWDGSTEAVGH